MRHTLSFLLFFSLITSILFAQTIDIDQLKGMDIRSLGPAGMSGRVTSIDVIHDQPEVIYIGTASGGLWRSDNGGVAWEPLFDEQDLSSIGAVAINQQNPDVIWAGTGEGNPRNSQTSGGGIYKSIDGGKHWKLMGLEGTKTIHRIILHRDDPNTVFVAALGSAWGTNPERGVYRTIDGGENWEKVLYVNDSTGCADLVVDPSNPNKLVAAMWQYGRKPWTFNSGGKGSGLYITFDGGKTWQERTDKQGLPKGDLGRIGLAIAPSNPKIIYALVEAKTNALYKSTDGGFKWNKVSDKNIGNRPFYYADIFVDPENENRIYNLHSVVTISEDGGKTFRTLIPWTEVHPDHHAFWVHPNDPNYLIEGNDGGMAISRDRGKTWRFVENLPLAQFYHIGIDMDIPYNVYGGMQDNGSWRGPSQVWQRGGIRNSHWTELYFGDGFDVVSQPGNNRYGYAMSQGGNVGRYDFKTGAVAYVQPVHPEGKTLRFNWNAAIAQDPRAECGLYFGSQFVHYSTDCGNSWEIISPDLTTNDTTKQQQDKSGGLTIDATQAENNTTILAIAPSPVDEGLIWVGTDDGNLQLTRNGGKSWENLSKKLPGAPKEAWIPQIEVSNYAGGEAFVVLNNYRQNDWAPYLYHTRDYGKTWRRLADEKKVNGHVLSIVQDPKEPSLLFMGTEQGLWFSIDYGTNWQQWKKGFPSVPVRDLKIHPREHDLVVGTFGRAAWILDDIRPLRAIAKTKGEVLKKDLVAFTPPDAYLAAWKSYAGTRFTAGAHFKGENRGPGALISYWVKDPGGKKPEMKMGKDKDEVEMEEEETEEEEQENPKYKGKVRFTVLSLQGDTIRDIAIKPDTGLNRFSWRLNHDGIRFPSWRTPKPGDNTPGGHRVLPGTYQIHLAFGEHKDSTQVVVHPDPRVEFDRAATAAKYELLESRMALVGEAWERVEDLKKAKEQANGLQGLVDRLPEAEQDSLKKQIGEVTKQLDKLLHAFLQPQNQKGIQYDPNQVSPKIWKAGELMDSSFGKPGENADNGWKIAEKAIREEFGKIDSFWDEEWKPLMENVSGLDIPLLEPLGSE